MVHRRFLGQLLPLQRGQARDPEFHGSDHGSHDDLLVARDSLGVKTVSNFIQSRMDIKSSGQGGNRLEKLGLFLGKSDGVEGAVTQLTAELQPWVDHGLHLELKTRKFYERFERLDLATSEWE